MLLLQFQSLRLLKLNLNQRVTAPLCAENVLTYDDSVTSWMTLRLLKRNAFCRGTYPARIGTNCSVDLMLHGCRWRPIDKRPGCRAFVHSGVFVK
jgi:hypothetical protein